MKVPEKVPVVLSAGEVETFFRHIAILKHRAVLMLCYGSANRDDDAFPDPDSFRIDRKPNRHVAFGYGAHLCLGQYLGRLEMRILFEELLPHLKSVELAGTPAMSEALFVNGPKRVPIRFTPN
jgi:cytochrome P450